MKSCKLWTVLILAAALSAGSGATLLLMNSCDLGGGSDGGAGADMVASDYYNKTEVDGLVDGVFSGIPNDTYQPLTGVTFTGRTVTGWVVPPGATAGFFDVNVFGGSTIPGTLNIVVSSATSDEVPAIGFNADSTGYTTATFIAPGLTAGSTVYAWHTNDPHVGAANLGSATVSVRCRGWIR